MSRLSQKEKKNVILKNKKSAHATNEAAKAENVCIGDDIQRQKKNKKWRLTFLGTWHNVCSRFYIQMSSSRRPLRGLFTLSRKLISYSLAADRKLTLTCEWHTNSRLVGLLNFSSDQSFYTNTGQNLSPYSLFFSLWCFSSPPFFFFAHAQRLMNGQLKQIKFRCTERCGALLKMWWADVFVCGDVSAVCVRARVCLCVSLCVRSKSKAAPCSVFFFFACKRSESACLLYHPAFRVLYCFSGSNGPQLAFAHWSQAASPT